MCASRVRVWKFRLGQSISHHEHEQCPTAGRLSSSRPAGAGRSGLNVPSRRAAALAARTPTRDHSRSTAKRNSERERLERLEVRFTRPRVAHQQRVSSSVISVRNGRFAVRRVSPRRRVRASAPGSPQRMTRIDGAGPGVRMRGAASSRPSRPLPRTDSGPPSRSTPPVHRLINFTTHCTAARG